MISRAQGKRTRESGKSVFAMTLNCPTGRQGGMAGCLDTPGATRTSVVPIPADEQRADQGYYDDRLHYEHRPFG